MPDISDDIKNAVASAHEEVTGEKIGSGAAVVDNTDATAEAVPVKAEADKDEAEPAKPAKEAKPEPEEEEEEFRLSADELEAIDADPKLKKAYKSMLRDYRKKTTTVAEERRAIADKTRIVELMASDPDGAVRALASLRGLKLVEPEDKAAPTKSEVDAAFDQLTELVGPEGAKALRPVFEATVNSAIKRVVDEHVTPLEQRANAFAQSALAQSIESNLAKYRANVAESGGEWDEELELEMAGLIHKIQPTPDTEFDDYLDVLYQTATSRRTKANDTKERVARLKAAAATREPGRPSRATTETPASITRDTPLPDAIALAVKQAQRELGTR